MMDTTEATAGPETPSLEGLNNAETAFDLLQSLAEEESPDEATTNAVERLALDADDEALRAAALQTLAAPGFQIKRRKKHPLSSSQRELLLGHISQWQRDSLLSDAQTAVLQARYPNPRLLRRQASKQPAKAAEKPASLSEILLGETAVKIALYMGAFFVLSAAFIFAAAVESLRLPILLVMTTLVLGVSLGLKRRLPQASFAFAVLGTLLVPLDAAVLADLLSLKGNFSDAYWMFAALGMTALWAAALWLFRSRFFSILALFAANAAGFYFGRLLPFTGFDLVFAALPTLAALQAARILRNWQGDKLFRPFFIMAQVQEIAWLSAGLLIWLGTSMQHHTPAAQWVAPGLLFLLGAAFYASSHAVQRFFAFPWAAAFVLWPVPLFLLQTFSPSDMLRSLLLLAWGTLLAIAGEVAFNFKAKNYWRNFSWPLLSVSLPALWGAALLQADQRPGLASLIFGWAAIVYALFSWLKARWPVWTVTLLSALGAYTMLLLTDWVDALNIPQMWVWFLPAIFLLSVELGLRLRRISKQWRLPLLVLGVLTLLFAVIWAMGDPIFEDHYVWQASLFFVIWASYGLGYAALSRRPWIAYLATGSLMLSVVFAALALDLSNYLLPTTFLAVVYVVAGWGLSFITPKLANWTTVFRWSGLLYGTLWALTAPLQGGVSSVIAPALIAGCWTAEALRRKNVWLGFPTNGLYLLAYFMALITLNIDQPQFYSIGAAMLGFLMHYLLRKAEQPVAALLTGIVAQLILFSTTYIQTLLNEQFIYFLALFLQAVIVLAYGVVARLKSFIIIPILFAVLSVVTLAFSLFSGIPAMLLVGCVGTLLLTAGVAALALRERKQVTNDE
ncbi:MAG TPA: hypothetical protein G4N96_03175 [Chloroflexi bacterium]|nr:hypothetical protein [Chloroflexota bacterium]